jgi:multicomponent Na+:H+ antiporter subunit E
MDSRQESQRSREGRSAGQVIGLAITLAAVWLLLSGHFEPLLLLLGLISVLLVVFISVRMSVVDREGFPVHLTGRLVTYVPWLTKEIAKANWDVTRIILDPRLPISPAMESFRVTPRSDLGRVIYANSITLTPGTITTGIIDDVFEIHALTRAAWDGTEEGEMGRRVSQLEGEP